MEFFTKSKAIRLRSHLDKYLLAEDDQKTVRQSRNESSRKTIWTIELVEENNNSIRLKSSCGHYLTASQEPLLLGMTGKKVVQTPPPTTKLMYEALAGLIEWEPIRDGFQVKLRTRNGSYLRGNGATKPWRNTVTHDNPHRGSANNWVLWDVVMVDSSELEERCFEEFESRLSRFSSSLSEDSYVGSPTSHWSMESAESPVRQRGMEFFQNAKVIRLKGHLDKYLVAEDDQESIIQDRDGTSKFARWTVELIPGETSLRFKSCFGKYLTASHYPFLIGVTGRKVIQSLPKTMDSSLEWEPIREGSLVKFKTRHGKFLRAHGGPPPWKNHVTHDIPYRSSTQDEVLWNVEVLEIHAFTDSLLPKFDNDGLLLPTTELACAWHPPNNKPRRSQSEKHLKKLESSGSLVSSTPRAGDRLIFYKVADDKGNVDEASQEISFVFRGAGVGDLIRKLEEVTGLDGIVVCTPSPLNGKLYPLRLQLPPNNTTMHVVVIPSS